MGLARWHGLVCPVVPYIELCTLCVPRLALRGTGHIALPDVAVAAGHQKLLTRRPLRQTSTRPVPAL